MQDVKLICNGLLSALNTTLICVYGGGETTPTSVVRNMTLSDTDPSGAVKFTIAVVLLYGVGVIGLLGITARRNRRVEMMDKEVNEYLKMQLQRKAIKRRRKCKRSPKVIGKLVAALHSQNKTDDSDFVSPVKTKRLKKCNTWSEGMDTVAGFESNVDKTVSMSLLNEVRPKILPNNFSPVIFNKTSLLLPKCPQISHGSQPLIFHQSVKSDSLVCIEEENINEYPWVKSDDDKNLKDVLTTT